MTAFRDLIKPVWAVAILFAAAQAEELPQIELPDVVISGVERATVIRAERLPVTPPELRFAPAEGIITERPAIQAQSIEIMPSRPLPPDILRVRCWGGRAGGGGFASVTGRLEAGLPVKDVTFGLRGGFDKRPRRIQRGWNYTGGGEVNMTHPAFTHSQAFYKLGFNAEAFRLSALLSDRKWRDFYGSAQLSQTPSPWGKWEGHAKFNIWEKENPYRDSGSEWVFLVNHQSEIQSKPIESQLRAEFEPLNGDPGSVGVFALRSLADFRLKSDLLLRAGLQFYSGTSARFGRTLGLDPQAEIEWNFSRIERVSLTWNPGWELFTARQLARDYPMAGVHTEEGSLAEDFARLSAAYERRINERGWLELRMKYQDTPHTPMPLNATEDNLWALGTTRLRWFASQAKTQWQLMDGFSASGAFGFNNAKAWNPNRRQEAPQIPPYFVEASLEKLGSKYEAALRLRCRDGAKVGLLDERRIPAHWESELWAAYDLGRGWGAFLQIGNLLNDGYWHIPGYDAPPLALRGGISFGSGVGNLMRKEY